MFKEAVAQFSEAMRLDPMNSVFPMEIASAYREMDRSGEKDHVEDVRKFLKMAVDNYPTNPYYRLKLAGFYESVGRKQDALVEYSRVRDIGVDNLQIRNKIRKLKEIEN